MKYFKITKLNYSDESSNLNFIDLREKLLHDKSFVFENLVFEIDVAEIVIYLTHTLTPKVHRSME